MAQSGIYFGGRTITIPGAYAVGDDSALLQVQLGALNVVAIVGSARGGKPNTPLFMNLANKEAGLAMLRGGDLYEAAKKAWTPSPDRRGADVIIAVRPDPAAQAQTTFNDGETTPAPALRAKARDWGEHGNGTQVQILPGQADATLRRVSIRKVEDNIDTVSPDLGNLLGLAYSGNGTAATVDIGDVSGDWTLTVAVTGATDGTAGFVKKLTDRDVKTIGKLVKWLNAQNGFSANLQGGETIPSERLDPIGTPVALDTAPVALRGINAAVVDWMNRFSPATVGEYVSNLFPVALSAPTFLTGGEDGTLSLAEWRAALRVLETEAPYFVVLASDDPAVHQAGLEHVLAMRDVKRKARRVLYTGGGIGQVVFNPDGTADLSDLEQAIFNLNSEAIVMPTPGIKDFDEDGEVVQRPSWYLAAALAGIKAGGRPQDGLTYAYVSAQGLEGNLNPSDLEKAIAIGASPVISVKGKGYRVVFGQCAQVRTTNVRQSEPSVLHCADTLEANLELFLEEKYTGKPVGSNLGLYLQQVKRDAQRVIDEGIALGLCLGISVVEKVAYANRRVDIKTKVYVTEPTNFITITNSYQPIVGAA